MSSDIEWSALAEATAAVLVALCLSCSRPDWLQNVTLVLVGDQDHPDLQPGLVEFSSVLVVGRGSVGGVLRLGGLDTVDDVRPARWVLDRLAPWNIPQELQVRSMVPSGFEAYGRLLHPAYRPRIDRSVERVRWRDIAAMTGVPLAGDVDFATVSDWEINQRPLPATFSQEPHDGDMDSDDLAQLGEVLGAFTTTPDHVWFCVWEGYGWPELARSTTSPRVHLEHRHCLLGVGPINTAGSPPTGQAPTLWWPDDRAWCVRTDIDGYSTYVAATTQCLRTLCDDNGLEVIPADMSDRTDPAPYRHRSDPT